MKVALLLKCFYEGMGILLVRPTSREAFLHATILLLALADLKTTYENIETTFKTWLILFNLRVLFTRETICNSEWIISR